MAEITILKKKPVVGVQMDYWGLAIEVFLYICGIGLLFSLYDLFSSLSKRKRLLKDKKNIPEFEPVQNIEDAAIEGFFLSVSALCITVSAITIPVSSIYWLIEGFWPDWTSLNYLALAGMIAGTIGLLLELASINRQGK